MKKIRKLVIILLLIVSVVTPTSFPLVGNSKVAEAASIKLSNKTLSLEVGKTKTLTITGTKKKATWSTTKKKVATVTKNGKVTALSAGTTTITALVDGKKLTCKVTVKKAANPLLSKAPFDAKEFNLGDINLVMPKDWTYQISDTEDGSYNVTFAPNINEEDLIIIDANDLEEAIEYDMIKDLLSENITAEIMQEELALSFDDTTVTISDFKTSDSKIGDITAFKVSYTISCYDNTTTLVQTQYMFIKDQYLISVSATNSSDLNIVPIAEYMIKSIAIKN